MTSTLWMLLHDSVTLCSQHKPGRGGNPNVIFLCVFQQLVASLNIFSWSETYFKAPYFHSAPHPCFLLWSVTSHDTHQSTPIGYTDRSTQGTEVRMCRSSVCLYKQWHHRALSKHWEHSVTVWNNMQSAQIELSLLLFILIILNVYSTTQSSSMFFTGWGFDHCVRLAPTAWRLFPDRSYRKTVWKNWNAISFDFHILFTQLFNLFFVNISFIQRQ